MSNRPLEEQLRERFDQHATPLDIDALWGEVEPRLPKKRKQGMPFWIWAMFGFALLTSLNWLLPEAPADVPTLQTKQLPTVPEEALTPSAPAKDIPLAPATAPLPNIPATSRTPAKVPVIAADRGQQELKSQHREEMMPEVVIAMEAPDVKEEVVASAKSINRPRVIGPPVQSPPSKPTIILMGTGTVDPVPEAIIELPTIAEEQIELRPQTNNVEEGVTKQTGNIRNAAEKVAAKIALAKTKAQRAEEKKEARLAKTAAEKTAQMRRTQARAATQNANKTTKLERFAAIKQRKLDRVKARNIAQDRTLAAKHTERLATARRNAQEAGEKNNAQDLAKQLSKEAKRTRREAENQQLLVQFEARNEAKEVRRQELAEKQRAQRAKRAVRAREWLAKKAEITPEEAQKAFQKELEDEAREKRLAFEKGEKERQRKVREILKKNRNKSVEEGRVATLLKTRQRLADRDANRVALAEHRQVLKADRFAEREARRNRRAEANANKEMKPKKIGKQRPPAYWTVEPGIALSLPSRSISGAGEQGRINSTYEKTLEGISLQGLVGYHWPTGLSLRTGLTANQINSKVESEITTQGFDHQQGIVAIIVNPDGSRREQIGTLQIPNKTVTTTRYFNAVSSLDIPLLLGYRFQGSKWGLTVEGGPTFNLSSGGSAQLYDGNGNYQLASNGHFRNKLTGVGVLMNFGGGYNLTEQTMLTANFRIQNFGSNGFEDQDVAGFSTNYTLIGVQLGYRIRF